MHVFQLFRGELPGEERDFPGPVQCRKSALQPGLPPCLPSLSFFLPPSLLSSLHYSFSFFHMLLQSMISIRGQFKSTGMHVSARLPFAQRYEGYIEQCRPYLGFLFPCSYWRVVTARPHIVLHLKRQSINGTCYLGSMESLSEAQTRNEGGCGFKNLGSRSGPSRCPCWVSV